jgi:hypothetical protein
LVKLSQEHLALEEREPSPAKHRALHHFQFVHLSLDGAGALLLFDAGTHCIIATAQAGGKALKRLGVLRAALSSQRLEVNSTRARRFRPCGALQFIRAAKAGGFLEGSDKRIRSNVSS